ncbi:hypothetical protein OXPF_14150 [Oxobacter pfennigii]|uniref:Type II secretion system protein G n=2 Tax=Oxobacter pfennigii TaxID=36849 RepID=A0A0P8WB44_9CLOT|nr:hypothetical protein OXPF_14150 [Oxobacter pfennigii]
MKFNIYRKLKAYTILEIALCLSMIALFALMIYPKMSANKEEALLKSDELTGLLIAHAVSDAIDDKRIINKSSSTQPSAINMNSIKEYLNFTPEVKSINVPDADFKIYIDMSGNIIVKIYNPIKDTEMQLVKLPKS